MTGQNGNSVENAAERIDLNLELVKKMGSKNGYDPIPPSQYLYFLDDPDPVQRVVAYIRSKTIRLGHRSPRAVHQDGSTVTIQDMADDCFSRDWANANRAWRQAEAQKLVAKGKAGELCLCGNVPSREIQRKPLENKEGAPVCTDWLKLCTDWSPPAYIREQLERLAEEERESFSAQYLRLLEWGEALEADAIAAARVERVARERLLLAKAGIQLRNGGKKRDLKAKPLSVQLRLIAEPNFDGQPVQTEPVQTGTRFEEQSVPAAENGLYKAENGGVQTDYSSVQTSPPLDSLKTSEDRENLSKVGSVVVVEETIPTPARTTTNPAEEIARMPDAEFKERMTRSFIDADRPNPNPRQIREVAESLPDHPAAREEFLATLNGRMHRIRNPGVLPGIVQEFREGWPAMLDKLAAEQEALEKQTAANDRARQRTIEDILSHWDHMDESERALFLEVYPEAKTKVPGGSP
jgi:hypothetical protein